MTRDSISPRAAVVAGAVMAVLVLGAAAGVHTRPSHASDLAIKRSTTDGRTDVIKV
jgi:hypothetical protein